MGNLCGNGKAMGANKRAPRDLKSLLEDIKEPSDLDRSPWAKEFRTYLKKLSKDQSNVSELEAKLDFVAMAGALRAKGDEIRQHKWKRPEIDRERLELLNVVGESFFTESSSTPIALSNKVLREELIEALEAVCGNAQVDSEAVDAACNLVWEARCDHLVYKAGVDRAYGCFLATKPSPPLSAVLLSIL